MKPDFSHLARFGIDRRVAMTLGQVVHAAGGETVVSVSSRVAHADAEFRAACEISRALGLEFRVGPLRIGFASGGQIRFIGDEYQRNLAGLDPDIVDGVHLLPVHADLWRAHGVETW